MPNLITFAWPWPDADRYAGGPEPQQQAGEAPVAANQQQQPQQPPPPTQQQQQGQPAQPACDNGGEASGSDEEGEEQFHDALSSLGEVYQLQGGKRATLCVSSEVGCAMGCTFCATGASAGLACWMPC